MLATVAPHTAALQALVLGVQQLEVPALQVICWPQLLVTIAPHTCPVQALVVGVQQPEPAAQVTGSRQLLVTFAPHSWPVQASVLSGVQSRQPPSATQMAPVRQTVPGARWLVATHEPTLPLQAVCAVKHAPASQGALGTQTWQPPAESHIPPSHGVPGVAMPCERHDTTPLAHDTWPTRHAPGVHAVPAAQVMQAPVGEQTPPSQVEPVGEFPPASHVPASQFVWPRRHCSTGVQVEPC